MRQYVLTGAVVLAMCAPAFAKTKAPKAVSDQTFVKKAAAGGMAEVELGRLAQQNGRSAEVKSFGQRMVDDHSKANDQLKSIAQSKNITLPTTLNAKDRALRDRLAKLQGDQFDKAYMQAMVRDHKKDVNEFRRESTAAKDPDVKQFAATTLPTLEEHLKLAESTDKAVGTSGTLKK